MELGLLDLVSTGFSGSRELVFFWQCSVSSRNIKLVQFLVELEQLLHSATEIPGPSDITDDPEPEISSKPPEKKISLSIEKLRKMVDEQDK